MSTTKKNALRRDEFIAKYGDCEDSNSIDWYVLSGPNSHWCHVVGDKLINPIVGIYSIYSLLGFRIQGGMTMTKCKEFRPWHVWKDWGEHKLTRFSLCANYWVCKCFVFWELIAKSINSIFHFYFLSFFPQIGAITIQCCKMISFEVWTATWRECNAI